MRRTKVYDADGKEVGQFDKTPHKIVNSDEMRKGTHNERIIYLNKQNYYVRGQTTSKGIKIK